MSDSTLYEKYGGFGVVNRIVMAFYDALLDSDEIGPYFDEIDMRKLIDHQTKFVAGLMGGPVEFTDDHLRRAHARLNITNPHFDEMKQQLADTLLDHGVDEADVALVLTEIEARRGLVVIA